MLHRNLLVPVLPAITPMLVVLLAQAQAIVIISNILLLVDQRNTLLLVVANLLSVVSVGIHLTPILILGLIGLKVVILVTLSPPKPNLILTFPLWVRGIKSIKLGVCRPVGSSGQLPSTIAPTRTTCTSTPPTPASATAVRRTPAMSAA